MLNDSAARIKATDPSGSYLVQAPAGSGKTEILTQRYLRLLSGVQAPEQIIALTFTRKAASEMRERILHALHQAQNNAIATSEHQQKTYAFAAEALTRDKAFDWQLLKQPGRLRIITIDALCQTLAHAIPLQDSLISFAKISDLPETHYIAAARACLSFAIENTEYHPCLKTLLHHVDNRQDQLLALFRGLLANRAQWLPVIYLAKAQDKTTYEDALASIIQHELDRFQQSIPSECLQILPTLARQVALIEANPDSPRASLATWAGFHTLQRQDVRSLAALLLTSQNTLRKAFDHHVGLKRGACDNAEYDALKALSKTQLALLQESPDFLNALLRVKNLPDPHYDSEQWDVLQALFALLPILTAHLHVQFNQHSSVDFSAISEQALQALGDDDCPTDLALYLDHRIHHLLVDEFQDTSIQQFHLLTKLVQNWQPNDGKTVFVVGDPMQSIYRFRSAEVGLFLQAKQHGIGPVPLIPLELTSNFRSTAPLVNWVNQHFQLIFPKADDIELGAVSFHPSTHVKPEEDGSHIMAFQTHNRLEEAKALVNQVALELQTHPMDTIAILVRSRKQLSHIVRCLRDNNIPFQGIEIDLLAKLPHLRDVWSLTQALLMPTNRLAWLAFLRSPWCGLSLSDLLSIAQFSKNSSIYDTLSDLNLIPNLSSEGRIRSAFVYSVLDQALTYRHQQPLISWLMNTLKQLQGGKILTSSEQDDLEQFWLLLERFEKDGLIEDMDQFHQEFNKLYSKQVVPSRLQIMTIHKSKGLEFDCVFLPGLSTRALNNDKPMLRWLQLPSERHQELLLVSPVKAAHHEHCILYDYLGKLDAEKNDYELQRLLYVAVTRAKKRLYLFDNKDKINAKTFRYLLQHQPFVTPDTTDATPEPITSYPSLFRLPTSFYQDGPSLIEIPANNLPQISTNPIPRLFGIVAHDLLQWICDNHPSNPEQIPWELAHCHLKSLGLSSSPLEETFSTLKQQITQFFNHPIGQWIIQRHEEEHNEYELMVQNEQGFKTNIIDRTFCENGIRWIIDFKTGKDDESSETHHRQQVNHYARLFLHHHQPIQCGLFYLAENHWVTWENTDL